MFAIFINFLSHEYMFIVERLPWSYIKNYLMNNARAVVDGTGTGERSYKSVSSIFVQKSRPSEACSVIPIFIFKEKLTHNAENHQYVKR